METPRSWVHVATTIMMAKCVCSCVRELCGSKAASLWELRHLGGDVRRRNHRHCGWSIRQQRLRELRGHLIGEQLEPARQRCFPAARLRPRMRITNPEIRDSRYVWKRFAVQVLVVQLLDRLRGWFGSYHSPLAWPLRCSLRKSLKPNRAFAQQTPCRFAPR
jgi:hypothetical protein